MAKRPVTSAQQHARQRREWQNIVDGSEGAAVACEAVGQHRAAAIHRQTASNFRARIQQQKGGA